MGGKKAGLHKKGDIRTALSFMRGKSSNAIPIGDRQGPEHPKPGSPKKRHMSPPSPAPSEKHAAKSAKAQQHSPNAGASSAGSRPASPAAPPSPPSTELVPSPPEGDARSPLDRVRASLRRDRDRDRTAYPSADQRAPLPGLLACLPGHTVILTDDAAHDPHAPSVPSGRREHTNEGIPRAWPDGRRSPSKSHVRLSQALTEAKLFTPRTASRLLVMSPLPPAHTLLPQRLESRQDKAEGLLLGGLADSKSGPERSLFSSMLPDSGASLLPNTLRLSADRKTPIGGEDCAARCQDGFVLSDILGADLGAPERAGIPGLREGGTRRRGRDGPGSALGDSGRQLDGGLMMVLEGEEGETEAAAWPWLRGGSSLPGVLDASLDQDYESFDMKATAQRAGFLSLSGDVAAMADGELTQGRAKWSRGRGASEETQRQAEEGASRERWGGAGKSWGWGEGWQSGESEGALGGIWREEGEEGEERETTRNLGTSHCGIDLLRELHGDSDAGVGLDRDMGLLDARAPGLGGAGRGRGGGWMRRTAVDEAEVEEAEEAVIFRGLP